MKKIIPKETPKIPIQCYNCTECNTTFEARHKLKKHTTEQHEGNLVKSPERKCPRTKPKTNIKNCNSTKKSKKKVTTEGEKIYGKIVTMNVKKNREILRIF